MADLLRGVKSWPKVQTAGCSAGMKKTVPELEPFAFHPERKAGFNGQIVLTVSANGTHFPSGKHLAIGASIQGVGFGLAKFEINIVAFASFD